MVYIVADCEIILWRRSGGLS